MTGKYKFITIKGNIGKFYFHKNEKYIRDNKFITNGTLPYHIDAKEKANVLRKNMTDCEKKIWNNYLKNLDINVNRQKPIDHFIADFYIPSCKLIIEIDGGIHTMKEQSYYDNWRDELIQMYGIMVVRITNYNLETHFESVIEELSKIIEHTNKKKKN